MAIGFGLSKTGIFSGTNKFVRESIADAQYATAAMVVGGAGAAYGAANGMFSDHTTVMGGAVGGAMMGAATGAAIAYGVHRSAGIRNLVDDLNLKMFGSNSAKGGIEKIEIAAGRGDTGDKFYDSIARGMNSGSKVDSGYKQADNIDMVARRMAARDEGNATGAFDFAAKYKEHRTNLDAAFSRI